MIISGITTTEGQAHYLRLCLEVKLLVDKWFQGLDQVMKTDWGQLEPAFMQHWMTHQAPQKSYQEKIEELLNHRLKPEQVSEVVPFWGMSEYMHIAWVEEVHKKVQDLGINTRPEYVYQVFSTLLDTIKDGIEDQTADWMTFIMAVKGINIKKLRARAKAEKKQVDKDREQADKEKRQAEKEWARESEMEEL
jgi:hypothetical protein